MERIMNEENVWNHNMEGDAVAGPVVCISRDKVLQALNEMKAENVHGPSDVSLALIAASGKVAIQMMDEICQSHRRIWNAS